MKRRYIAFFISITLFLQCTSLHVPDLIQKEEQDTTKIAEIKKKLLQGAESLVGKDTIIVNGKKFINDCVNTVLAIYYFAGIDLSKEFGKYSGNGVRRLYKTLENHELIYSTHSPAPGDIVFWDNTWDMNGDGIYNDPLTHVGMIVKISDEGNLEYIHYNYIKGIVYEKMNLNNPDTYSKIVNGKTIIINSPLQMKEKGKAHSNKWLSSHLYKSFGKGYLME